MVSKTKTPNKGAFKKGVSGNPNKECRICNELKALSSFYARSSSTDGKDSRCKSCESIRRKISYQFNFERESYHRIRNRCKRRGILFDLDMSDIPPLPNTCPILKFKLEINWGGKAQSEKSPTLDKIIPSLGYTRGNVCWISSKANLLKTNNTIETLKAILEYLNERR